MMTRQFYLWCALKWVEIQILGYLSGKGSAPHPTRHGRLAGLQGQHLQDELVGGEVSGCLCHCRMVRMGKDQSSRAVAHARCPSGPVPLLAMSSLSSLLLICQWIYYSKRFARLGCPQPVTSCLGSQVAGVSDV